MAAKSQGVFSHDAIMRRLQVGGMGANGPRGGKKQLSPSNSRGAGSMLKTNIKPKGANAAALKRLRTPR